MDNGTIRGRMPAVVYHPPTSEWNKNSKSGHCTLNLRVYFETICGGKFPNWTE
jgi:hypothetical protein